MMQPNVQNRRNGHRGEGITSEGFNPGTFSQGQFPSAMKYYVQPGEDVTELLMRANIHSEKERLGIIGSLGRYKEFHQQRHYEMLLSHLAASDSFGAERMIKLTEAVTGHFRAERKDMKRTILQKFKRPPEESAEE